MNAFSSEITTGMSAPPIGSTNITPKTSASAMSATIAHCASTPATIATPSASRAAEHETFTTFWPGKTIGRPLTSSWSFANATSEPEKEIEPISAERAIGQRLVPDAARRRARGTRRAR